MSHQYLLQAVDSCVCMWRMCAWYSDHKEDPEDELQVVDGCLCMCACVCVYVVHVCVVYLLRRGS